ncbi:MAG TPA: TrkA C-terminal domain-containing protein [Crenalkalicoccus sp.]|jgi:TrkA domain protein|nr:TrkA C-terminal domain-containing protein [Crenalkalicoccus sp.]
MEVHERPLPGVGHRYRVRPEAGGELVVVVHHSGRRELLYFAPNEEEPRMMLELADREARELGAILAGMLFQPEAVGAVSTRLAGHAIEWHQLEVGSRWVGKTVGDLWSTDCHVVAILRGDVLIPNPPPDTRLEPDDTIVVIGMRGAVSDFRIHLQDPSP